jgi:DNA-binding NarL/FixJ family response regulator
MRIVICDDHRLLVEALAATIVRAGHTVQAITWTPEDGLAAVERYRPDILLLDLNFPDGDSLGTARQMVARYPCTRTVLLTGSESVGPLREALRIGVAGYLRKDEWIDKMLLTLERCVSGEPVFDEVLMKRLERATPGLEQNGALPIEFTPRERAVADLLQVGLNTTEIVSTLGISRSTVRTHVQAILNKLAVHSRVQAVAVLGGPLPFRRQGVS